MERDRSDFAVMNRMIDHIRLLIAVDDEAIPVKKKLEAQAERETLVQRAEAAAEASKIQAQADAERRKTMADAEAYALRTTSLAQFEELEREAKLVSANPLLIPKTFADRLSERVQVILTPSIGGEALTSEVFKRVVNGQPAVADPPASPATVQARAKRDSGTH